MIRYKTKKSIYIIKLNILGRDIPCLLGMILSTKIGSVYVLGS